MATERRTRPVASARNSAAMKPTDLKSLNDRGEELASRMKTAPFPGFANANMTDRAKEKYQAELEVFNKSLVDKHTGMFTVGVLMGRGGMDRDSMKILDFSEDIKEFEELPSKEEIIGRYKQKFGRLKVGKAQTPIKDIPDTRIITMRGRPDIDFTRKRGEAELVQPNDRYTTQQMIVNFIKDVKDIQRETVTVGNIADLVANSSSADGDPQSHASKQKQTPLLASILNSFTSKPDRGEAMFPFQVVPDISMLPDEYQIAVKNSIIVDFGEVIGPVALATGNVTGNARRVMTEFLQGTTGDIMKNATIHFNPGKTSGLYDSFIQLNGRVVGISSKGHTNGNKPSGGTAISTMTKAINEVKTNQESLKLLKELFRKPENKQMFNIISAMANENNFEVWERTVRIIQLMNPQEYPTTLMYRDIKHIKSHLQMIKQSQTRLPKNKASASGELLALNYRVKSVVTSGLSPFLKALFTDKKTERPQEDDKTMFEKFARKNAAKIARELNANPLFSSVAAWILNHSATVQVDLIEAEEPSARNAAYGKALVITNIVATWPSQAVDSIKLLEDKSSLRFVIAVNGYEQQFPGGNFKDTGFLDMIPAEEGDRDFSTMRTSKDWKANGVNGPRTTTDLHDLPANTAEFTPPEQVAQTTKVTKTGQTKAAKTLTANPQNPVTVAITGFVDSLGLKRSTTTEVLAYLTDRLTRQGIESTIRANLSRLVSVPEVANLIKQHTSQLASHPTGVTGNVFEAAIADDHALSIVSAMYWILLLRQYSQAPGGISHQNFNKIKENITNLFVAMGAGASRLGYLAAALKSVERTANREQPAPAPKQDAKPAKAVSEPADQYGSMKALDAIHAVNGGNGMKAIQDLRAEYGKQSVDRALQSYTWNQFKAAYMPSDEERRIRGIIATAKRQGRAQDEALARKEIAGYGLDNSDEDLAGALSETQ